MTLFDTPGADAAYERWLDPPESKCPSECNCEECHERHREAGDVIENAIERWENFLCCVDALDEMKQKGLVCPKHPRADFVIATKWCEQCEAEAKP